MQPTRCAASAACWSCRSVVACSAWGRWIRLGRTPCWPRSPKPRGREPELRRRGGRGRRDDRCRRGRRDGGGRARAWRRAATQEAAGELEQRLDLGASEHDFAANVGAVGLEAALLDELFLA